MTTTDAQAGTNVAEIAAGLFRISTPVPVDGIPGGFTFNQFLLVDEEPLLFHTGPRRLFSVTRDAVRSVLPLERLRWIAFSHFEADECGSLNEWLAAAPRSQPLCSQLAAVVSVSDVADRAPRGLGDGETLSLGRRTVRWLDTPHLPHGMECGYLFDETDRALLCGDLFCQPGSSVAALTESASAIWEPSEVLRQSFPYAPIRDAGGVVDRLARHEPRVLACMHGSSFAGDGGALLRQLGAALAA
jgi:glyoxylase-like metal-dependent hydrolase (beta-lactamase superfamily II)